MNIFIKVLPIFLLLLLTNCVNRQEIANQNLEDLRSKKVVAVISGCSFENKDYSMSCRLKWRQLSDDNYNNIGIEFEDEYTTLSFIKPGTYQFLGISASTMTSTQIKTFSFDYTDKKPKLITDFTVKGGDIIYIGYIYVDAKKTNLAMHSLGIRYYNKETVLEYLKKGYSYYFTGQENLLENFKDRYVKLTEEAKFIKKYVPVVE
jgi:hypothetical protein